MDALYINWQPDERLAWYLNRILPPHDGIQAAVSGFHNTSLVLTDHKILLIFRQNANEMELAAGFFALIYDRDFIADARLNDYDIEGAELVLSPQDFTTNSYRDYLPSQADWHRLHFPSSWVPQMLDLMDLLMEDLEKNRDQRNAINNNFIAIDLAP